MSTKKQYNEAITRGKKVGWANADDDSMLASVAQLLTVITIPALNPWVIYGAAKKAGKTHLELAKMSGLEINEMFWEQEE